MFPRRFSPINSHSSTISYASSQSISPAPLEKDIYDIFIDIYFENDIKVQSILLKTINVYVGHPAYTHLLKTMDLTNAHHVMGYLRSQRSTEMYYILNHIICNPRPTKYDFYRSIGQ